MRLTPKRILEEAGRLLMAGQADLARAVELDAEAARLQARAKRRLELVQRIARDHQGESARA
jgi:hypothetical protein